MSAKPHPAGEGEERTEMSEEQAAPWWRGTVIPTGRYRLKEAPNGRVYLQELITDIGGWNRRWVERPRVGPEVSDDA